MHVVCTVLADAMLPVHVSSQMSLGPQGNAGSGAST